MPEFVIPDVADSVLQRLQERASAHGRTAEVEAKAILAEALQSARHDDWAGVDAIYDRLAASGRSFSDSADLLREDREKR